jgi:hypothetical protein
MNRIPFTRVTAALTLALAALTCPLAKAAMVNVDFIVKTDNPIGNYGDTFSGHLSYDDAAVQSLPPPSGFGEDVVAISSFSFGFAGQTYVLDDVPGAVLLIDPDPATGGLLGLEASNSLFSFLPALIGGGFPAQFNYELPSDDFGFGTVTYTVKVDTVPEPASLGLLAAALAAAGLARRRATARR